MGQTELEYEPESSVEPEVRACVASLVSAVCLPHASLHVTLLTQHSSVALVPLTMVVMFSEMTRWQY